MGEKRAYKPRKPGGGRRKSKPEYDAGKILGELMDSAVVLYEAGMSLQAIADELGLNPIKVRKLLITAGVYVSDVAEKVQETFDDFRKTQDHKSCCPFNCKCSWPVQVLCYFISSVQKGCVFSMHSTDR